MSEIIILDIDDGVDGNLTYLGQALPASPEAIEEMMTGAKVPRPYIWKMPNSSSKNDRRGGSFCQDRYLLAGFIVVALSAAAGAFACFPLHKMVELCRSGGVLTNLTSVDFVVLEYISKNEPVSKADAKKNLTSKIDSLDYRLTLLITPSGDTAYVNRHAEWRDDYNYVEMYSLSRCGKTVLQDYRENESRKRKDQWLENAWIPIIVAFVTTVLTNYLLPMLPQILGWLPSVFQEISWRFS